MVTLFCPLKGLIKIVQNELRIDVFMDTIYSGIYCKSVMKVDVLPESRKGAGGPKTLREGRKMVRGRQPAEWVKYALL